MMKVERMLSDAIRCYSQLIRDEIERTTHVEVAGKSGNLITIST